MESTLFVLQIVLAIVIVILVLLQKSSSMDLVVTVEAMNLYLEQKDQLVF